MMHFTVAVEEMMPGILLKESNKTLTAKGPIIDLLLLISEKLNFTYSLKRSVDNSWGSFGQNGWTGMIGMIFRNEADFSISPFTLTYERWSVLQTSVPVFVDHVEIVLPFREFQISLFTVLTIYKWDVWLALFLAVFILSLITTASNPFYNVEMSFAQAVRSYLWQAYRNFLLQGYKPSSRYPVVRVLSMLLMLLTLVMSYVFSGSLLTTLVVRRVRPIESLSDLVESDICPILEKHSSTYAKFENAQSEEMRKLFLRAKEDPDRNIIPLKDFPTKGMDLVDAGSHAVMMDTSIVRSIMANKIRSGQDCSYRIAKYPVDTMWKVLVFSDAFPRDLLNKINQIIHRSTETGLLYFRMQQEFDGYKYCLDQVGGQIKSLRFDHVTGVFLIWSTGCLIGLVILLVERYLSGSSKTFEYENNY